MLAATGDEFDPQLETAVPGDDGVLDVGVDLHDRATRQDSHPVSGDRDVTATGHRGDHDPRRVAVRRQPLTRLESNREMAAMRSVLNLGNNWPVRDR